MIRAPIPFWPEGDAGAIAPLAAVSLAVVVGMAGLATDVGVWYVQKRNLQAATDAAALAAANRPANPLALAREILETNGFKPSDVVSAESGYYCPSAAVAPANRFSTSPCGVGSQMAAGPNAVRLTTRTSGPAILSKVLNAGRGDPEIRSRAIAARIDEAGLTIGSGVVSADLPVVNGVLQSLVGGSGLSLSALEYNGLLKTQVDTLRFLDALATQLNVTGVTYGQLLTNQAKVTDILQASVNALDQQNQIVDVSAAIAGTNAIKSKVTGSSTVALGKLFDLGVWRDMPVGSSTKPAALHAGINAYQLASFTLQLANGSHAVAVPSSGLNIPGLLSFGIEATAIEPPQSAYFAYGPEGVSVHTAQVRAKVSLNAASGLVNLPFYIEAGQGTATVEEIGCGIDPATDGWVRVSARPGVASAYLGSVPANAMTNFTAPITAAQVADANLVDLSIPGLGGLAQVKLKAVASVAPSGPTTLTFTQPPITGVPVVTQLTTQGYIAKLATVTNLSNSSGLPAEAVSSGMLAGLGSKLASSLTLRVCLLNCLVDLGADGRVLAVLVPLLHGIDPLVDGILASLGVKLGRSEVLASGIRCGIPVIVG